MTLPVTHRQRAMVWLAENSGMTLLTMIASGFWFFGAVVEVEVMSFG